jgi:predicted small integral membrane protein
MDNMPKWFRLWESNHFKSLKREVRLHSYLLGMMATILIATFAVLLANFVGAP